MARRPGHEDCPTCNVCGLTYCPDCDTESRACPLLHEPALASDGGASTAEYGLLVAALAALALAVGFGAVQLTEAFERASIEQSQMQP